MGAELAMVFMIGLTSSAHCIGMCGGFALIAHGAGSRPRPRLRTVAWLAGKTTTYAIMGAVAGGFGYLVTGIAGALTVLSFAVGAFLVLIGLATAGVLPDRLPLVSAVGPGIGRLVGRLTARGSGGGPYALGLINGLLPCGLVYAVVAHAAATASALSGATVMTVFGLSTIPSLAATAWFGARLGPVVRKRIARIGGWLVVLFGLVIIVRTLVRLCASTPGPHMM